MTRSESILQQENLDHNMVKQNRPNLTTKYQTKVRSDCNQRCTLINTNQPHTVHVRRFPHGGAGFLSSFLSTTSSSPSFSASGTVSMFLSFLFFSRRFASAYFGYDDSLQSIHSPQIATRSQSIEKPLDKYVLQKQLFRRSFNLFPA